MFVSCYIALLTLYSLVKTTNCSCMLITLVIAIIYLSFLFFFNPILLEVCRDKIPQGVLVSTATQICMCINS